MKHIQGFLDKQVSFPVLEKKQIIVDIIFKETSQKIECSTISFSGKIIFLKLDSSIKIKILLKKNILINSFKKEKSLSFFSDIK